ncbi:heme-dependent oxidative N-demethylase subunit alpha family protein [Chryseolinea lacunae]|nr:heme-dependent oxidative N-demethylase subunit alpha family protein [Chryseolinea lacunae]
MKYLPFLNGTYSTTPGLSPMAKVGQGEPSRVFTIDDYYDHALANKQVCRDEDIHKYYREANPGPGTMQRVNRFIAETLVNDHPECFSFREENGFGRFLNRKTGKAIVWDDSGALIEGDYVSVFDALCSQLQEDVAVFQLEGDQDWLAAIHLCAPNHWDPAEKIGNPFSHIHAPVPGMERTLKHYPVMLATLVSRGPFTRFAWGVATDTRLNHHPIAPERVDHDFWYGRKTDTQSPKFYIRTERQNLVGFPEANAFLFTIHTYFYDVDALTGEEKLALLAAIGTMSEDTLRYKGLVESRAVLEKKLKE